MSKLKVLGMLLGILLLLSGCMVFEPIGPEVLYERDFNSDKDWSATGDGLWDMWIGDGAFHVLVKVEDLSVVSTLQAGDLADFQLDVDAQQIAGPDDNGYGVQFRYTDKNNSYRFRISGDGWVRFDKWVNGSVVVIRDWERSSLINQGNALNHITIVANGTLFTFYINGTEVYSEIDTQFSSGIIGFVAVMLSSPGQTHVTFDNLIIQALE